MKNLEIPNKLQAGSGCSLLLCHYMALCVSLVKFKYIPTEQPGLEADETLTRLARCTGQGPENINIKSFFFSLSLFLTQHWESWGSPRWSIKSLTRRNWRYQWIHSVFSLYPHCFATFLYSHVFLYINILKIFCRSLFIKVIFSRPQPFLKWHEGHESFLHFTQKGSVWVHFQSQLFVLVEKKKNHCPTWCVACFYPLFFPKKSGAFKVH